MPAASLIDLADRLQTLSSVEDFLRFFAVRHDERAVRLNRDEIHQRFLQYLHAEADLINLDEVSLYRRYRSLLQQAYRDATVPNLGRESNAPSVRRFPGGQPGWLNNSLKTLHGQRQVA